MELKLTIRADDADVLAAIGFICAHNETPPWRIFKDFFQDGAKEVDFTLFAPEEHTKKIYHLNGMVALLLTMITETEERQPPKILVVK